ncbi:MAG: outer membrane protein transport protein [Bacteroides sp.]|nr:outer membrane protein transport protein [Bacteroides sp.]MCM1413382.1 outer membrane protein transport protein [Bacteroides sp.]MCM1471932.1 outer membrane protein transport protein [Bacteroides sp.]
MNLKKKIIAMTLAAATIATTNAEGYQINTLSARQLGMGHTGTALKLGAENMIFNPAGLGFSDKQIDITASVTGIKAIAEATVGGTTYKTHNGLSTPLAVNAAFRVYDNLQAGISFYTPYGSAIDWTNNWPGSMLSQRVNLKVYTIQPTLSWRILPNLSVGAGLMISWGKVDLDKALVSGASFDAIAGTQLGDAAAASINLNGTSDVAIGVNLGAMYDINSRWTVGANFRTKMGMKVDAGIARVNYANKAIEERLESTLGLINESNFSAEMPCPYILNLGVAYRPIKGLQLAFDAQLTGWKTYRQLDIEFPSPLESFNQNIPKNYHNAWCFHLGAEYELTKRFDLRAGLMVDTSPVNDEHYNPETPGMTKIEPTVGFTFRPTKHLAIDVAFMYIHGTGVDGASCQYDDLMLKAAGMPESVYRKTFTADYDVKAFAPAIGVRYNF